MSILGALGLGVAWIAFWIVVTVYLDWSLKRRIRGQMMRRKGYWYDRARGR